MASPLTLVPCLDPDTLEPTGSVVACPREGRQPLRALATECVGEPCWLCIGETPTACYVTLSDIRSCQDICWSAWPVSHKYVQVPPLNNLTFRFEQSTTDPCEYLFNFGNTIIHGFRETECRGEAEVLVRPLVGILHFMRTNQAPYFIGYWLRIWEDPPGYWTSFYGYAFSDSLDCMTASVALTNTQTHGCNGNVPFAGGVALIEPAI